MATARSSAAVSASSARIANRPIARGLIVAGTVALAITSVLSATAGALRTPAPDQVLRFSPNDPIAIVRKLDRQLTAKGAEMFRSATIADSARQSLRGRPLNSGALRFLATSLDLQGRTKSADALLQLSQRISRRDLGTQLVLLERQVQRGDVVGTLVHYDRILRVNVSMHPLLFAMFDTAAQEPEVAVALGNLLRSDPPWLPSFIDWTIADAKSLANLSKLYVTLGVGNKDVWNDVRRRALIQKFVSYGQPDTAFRLYANFSGVGRAQQAIRDGGFDAQSAYPPIDWQPASGVGLSATLTDRAASYSAEAGAAGTALTQLLNLSPGAYRFAAEFQAQGVTARNSPHWTISCFRGEAKAPVILDLASAAPVDGTFTVPSTACGHQWLKLDLQSSDSTDGQSGTIRQVRISR